MRRSTIWSVDSEKQVREGPLSWVRNSRVSLRFIAAAALLATAGAAAADILVVRSSGPSAKSYPPGKRLPESARITLKAADQLTVLDGRGTRTIRGPGTFTAGTARVAAAAAPAPAPGQRRARIGAVRGPGSTELRPPTIWHVDVSKSSAVCLADLSPPTLWRSDPAEALTLKVSGAGGAAHEIDWAAGDSTVAWPAELPVADGAAYRLSGKEGGEAVALTFRTLPQKPGGLEDMASSLIRNGCTAQLDLLIETVRLPDEAPAG